MIIIRKEENQEHSDTGSPIKALEDDNKKGQISPPFQCFYFYRLL